jgi:non-heme chloroperoxidase
LKAEGVGGPVKRGRDVWAIRAFITVIFASWLGMAPAGAADRYFVTSDGVRLHYAVAGPVTGETIVFVPGWTMPGWIFEPQIRAFAGRYRVVTFDPRGQGDSEIAASGYDQGRRGADIGELLAQLGPRPVVLVGWSLGVLDALAYVHQAGDRRIAGLVLIDNSVGENPAPKPRPPYRGPVLSHDAYMRAFVRGMFRTRQSPAYLARLTAAALEMPEADAAALLRYPVPRSYWREAVFSTNVPVLYVVRPGLSGQAENLLKDRPDTEIAVFARSGHALFVDDATKFDALMGRFLVTQVWPR